MLDLPSKMMSDLRIGGEEQCRVCARACGHIPRCLRWLCHDCITSGDKEVDIVDNISRWWWK